jgi:hypothetical protein
MLLRVLFLCAAVAVLGETMLQAAASLAIAALHQQGVAAARNEFGVAAGVAQSTLANAIAAGYTPAPLPSLTPTCAVTTDGGCTLTANATLAIATPSPSACPTSGCDFYLQGNDAVSESRTSVAIDVDVTDSEGEIVASRSGTVVFRSLRVPPYILSDGMLDATLDDTAGSAGEIGGSVPSGTSAGTLIDVVYQNARSGETIPANVWNGLGASAPLERAWTP